MSPSPPPITCMRQLKPRAKAEVRVLRAKKGVKAAIKRARKLAGK